MIELPPPAPDGRYTEHREVKRWGIGWAIAAAAVVLVVIVAIINGHRSHPSATPAGPLPTASALPKPSDPAQGGGGSNQVAPVSCPQIRDEQAHLAYTCIENALQQTDSDTFLDLRVVLNEEVEPGWVISEGSGDANATVQQPSTGVVRFHQEPTVASAQQVQAKVARRTALALQNAYGDSPTSRTLSAKSRTFAGVPGFEQVTEVTINTAYRAAQQLNVRTERLWVIGLPTSAGVSIFMMSIPDDRSGLWARAEQIVGTVHVI